MAWGLFLDNAWRVRLVMGIGAAYIAGIEAAPVIDRLVRNGVPIETAEDLIAACEQGFVVAKNEKDEDDGAQDQGNRHTPVGQRQGVGRTGS